MSGIGRQERERLYPTTLDIRSSLRAAQIRARWRFLRQAVAVLVVILLALGLARAAGAETPFAWPNGGDLEASKVVARPGGGFEVFPARCTVFEDGSVRCPDWEGNPGASVTETGARLDRLDAAANELRRGLEYLIEAAPSRADFDRLIAAARECKR